jgi:transcriptional regulator GlxA family with amidase domain
MTLALLTMSQEEIDRAEWMLRIRERRATQAQVAERLGLNVRQVERMLGNISGSSPTEITGAASLPSRLNLG